MTFQMPQRSRCGIKLPVSKLLQLQSIIVMVVFVFQKVEIIVKEALSLQHVRFDGLGAMGFGMVSTLLREKFIDCGFDVYEPTLVRCRKFGGLIGNSSAEAVMSFCSNGTKIDNDSGLKMGIFT